MGGTESRRWNSARVQQFPRQSCMKRRGTFQFSVQFCVEDSNNVKWKHADANILSWKRSHELLTWRNVERMIGILIWDWSVANRSRSKIELVIDAARKIGNLQLEGRLWELTHTLTQEHVVISRRDEISGCRGANISTWSGFGGPHMGAKP